MPPTPLPIRQQIIKLRKKDNLSIGAIAKIVDKSKSVVHNILKVYDDSGCVKQENLQLGPEKQQRGKILQW